MSLCSKPGCQGAAAAVLSYDYAARLATLDDPGEAMLDPHLYVLCGSCADRLSPPRGWDLTDRRSEPPLFLARDAATSTIEIHDVLGEDGSSADQEERDSRQLFFGHSA